MFDRILNNPLNVLPFLYSIEKGLVVQIPSEEQGAASLIKFSPIHNTKENLDPYHIEETPPSLNDVEHMMELEELDQIEFQMGTLEIEMEIDENSP